MSFTQGVFYYNIPSKILGYNNTARLPSVFKKTFIKFKKNPLFVYTGTGSVNFDFLKKDKKILKKLSKRPVDIYLYEPVSYYFKEEGFTLGYYSEFHSDYNNSQDLLAAELDSVQELSKEVGTIRLNHCDYRLEKVLGSNYTGIKFQCRDLFIRQAAVSYMPVSSKKIPVITKKFWCGNGRYTIHRHLVMCFLADKLGSYSWHFTADTDWSIDKSWIDDKLDIKYLEQNNKILNSKEFSLEFNTKKVIVQEKNCHYLPDGAFSQPNINYKKTFDPCFVCIINETRFAQPTANFSEKVIDAINYRKPFILVAPPKTLEYLKKFGFKTFDKYWDETYDTIENHSERLREIFKIIDEINNKTLDELNDMYYDMHDILEHNRNIIKNLPYNPVIINDK